MIQPDPLSVECDERGLHLPALGVWLDPVQAAPFAFVSHAHAATTAVAHGRVLASVETIGLAPGLAATPERVALAWEEARDVPVDAAFGGGVARLSIARAGHMLGAAQLVVEHGGRRLVYTGDWSGDADATRPAGAVVACDTLVVTTTFALPIFRFDPPAEVLEALVAWCASRWADGVTPVVLARTPGPAQLIVRALSARGVPVSADDDVRSSCAVYERLGVVLGPVRPYEAKACGSAVVASARLRATDLRVRGKSEVGYASGWALLDAAVEQKRADTAFVLADQADFDGLRALVRGSGAARVIASRGDARVFAKLVAADGVDAVAVELVSIDERGTS